MPLSSNEYEDRVICGEDSQDTGLWFRLIYGTLWGMLVELFRQFENICAEQE